MLSSSEYGALNMSCSLFKKRLNIFLTLFKKSLKLTLSLQSPDVLTFSVSPFSNKKRLNIFLHLKIDVLNGP